MAQTVTIATKAAVQTIVIASAEGNDLRVSVQTSKFTATFRKVVPAKSTDKGQTVNISHCVAALAPSRMQMCRQTLTNRLAIRLRPEAVM